jgi:hypothetical protein
MGGDVAGAATEDRMVPASSTVAVNGLFHRAVDWAAIGLGIRPGSGSVDLPDIAVAPGSYDYGDVVVDNSSAQIFTVRNDGSVNLDVNAITVLGANEFSIGDDSPFTLAPGASRELVVSFTPSSVGFRSAMLLIESNDTDESPLAVDMSGNGVESPPGGGPVIFEEVQSGESMSLGSVTTAGSLAAVSGHLYLAAISFKPDVTVSTVSGLGLVWTPVRAQCAGRSATGIEVWMAQGSPTIGGPVTATLASVPKSAVIAVSRYSGVDTIGNLVSGNTNGVDGVCFGGTDNAGYAFNLTTTGDGAVVYGAVAMRNKRHTPGAGYEERVEIAMGTGGDVAGAATEDRMVPVSSTVAVDGVFSSAVDWAAIGLEIRLQ